MRIGFRFRVVPFVATVLVVALGVALGQWQDRRAAGKLALAATMAERSLAAPLRLSGAWVPTGAIEYRKVTARGVFVRDWPVYLENRPYQGRAGFYQVMPLRLDGSDRHVLVARGWFPRDKTERARLPIIETPAGSVTVSGLARGGMGRVMELGAAAPLARGAIVQNLSPAQFAQASALKLYPFMLEQDDPPGPDELLVRDWPGPALGVEKHQGYAFQWYALSVMALLFFVITGCRRGNKAN